MRYGDEVERLRERYNALMASGEDGLKKWFEETAHLNSAEHAIVMGKLVTSVRRLKRKAGRKPGNQRFARLVRAKPNPPLEVPENWKDPVWLASVYGQYSARAIAKAVGVNQWTVWHWAKRYGLVKKPNHACCNRDWLVKHYVEQSMSQDECAKLAGVHRKVLLDWLVMFKIPIRTPRETMAAKRSGYQARTNMWCREVHRKLSDSPMVRRVRKYESGIKVTYITGITETYWYERRSSKRRAYAINADNSVLKSVPPVYEQYPGVFESSRYPHHIVQVSDMNRATLLEQRMAVHSFMHKVRLPGWKRPEFPEHVLAAEWERVRESNDGRYVKGDAVRMYPDGLGRTVPGWSLAFHFFDPMPELGKWAKPGQMYRAITRAAESDRLDLTTGRALCAGCALWSVRLISPGLYADLFKYMAVKGPVLDLAPGLGFKAMACAMLGIEYLTLPDERLRAAVGHGLPELTGLKWSEYGGGKVDLLIAEDTFRKLDMGLAMQYADSASRMIAFATKSEADEIEELYSPSGWLPVRGGLPRVEFGRLFMW